MGIIGDFGAKDINVLSNLKLIKLVFTLCKAASFWNVKYNFIRPHIFFMYFISTVEE